MKTLLTNLKIPVGTNGTRSARILVGNDRILGILSQSESVEADKVEDLAGGLVLPAAIDPHVHFDDPGYTHREDFLTGTRAAAAGGVALVVDMPCTSIPDVTTIENLHRKLGHISSRAIVDFMLWGGISSQCLRRPDWKKQAMELMDSGVAAFKCYMISGMETFGALNTTQLRDVLTWAGSVGIPVGIHAEDPEVIEPLEAWAHQAGRDSPEAYAASRPPRAEVSAMRKLVSLAGTVGARIHVVHLASGEALRILKEAHAEGLPISAETCPHYLLFTRADLSSMGALLKTAPVVKDEFDRDALWGGLGSGDLAYVASDHAAAQYPEEKETGSIWTDYGGIPGVELLLSTLYSEGYRKGKLSLSRLVEVTSSAAADFLGIGTRKGRLAPGYDADLVLIDEEQTRVIRSKNLHNKNRYTPLEGREMKGLIRGTWVRGHRVYRLGENGEEEFARPGSGRWIRRGTTR